MRTCILYASTCTSLIARTHLRLVLESPVEILPSVQASEQPKRELVRGGREGERRQDKKICIIIVMFNVYKYMHVHVRT